MGYAKAFAIKFIMVFAIMWIALGLLDMPLLTIFYFSLLFSGISFVGDRLILPRYGNIAATAVDGALAFIIVLMASPFFVGGPLMAAFTAFLVAIFMAIGESIYHRYFEKAFFNDEVEEKDATFLTTDENLLQTEFASEIEIEREEVAEEKEVETVSNQKKKKNYVPHRKRNRNKKNPY